MKFNYQKICQSFVGVLPLKQKEVIERRFGLTAAPRETLQKIGDDLGITRERVRQIEAEGFLKLQEQKQEGDLRRVFVYFEKYIQNQGGAKREDILLKDLGKDDSQNQVNLLFTLGKPFHRFPETGDFYPFWALEKNISLSVEEITNNILHEFARTKKPLARNALFQSVKVLRGNKNSQLFLSTLEITKKIEQGPLGEFGLTVWPEIKPRGMRDRAYLTLKKAENPLHFTEIAALANNLSGDLDARKVLPQTVHNELIRDERFILVGRGIYALREWGYAPGTVKEIIVKVLKENKAPLNKEKILSEVQKQRLVKENTIFLNLANKNYFQRDKQGKYILRKA